MKTKPFIPYLLLIVITFGCNQNPNDQIQTIQENEFELKEPSPLDSFQTGVPISIALVEQEIVTPPTKIKKGIPTVTVANENIFPIISPGIKVINDNRTTQIPGSSGFKLPETKKAIGEVKKITFPATVPASPPATRDAAYYNLQYLDVDQGLSASYVMDIMEDSRGNLWISTWTAGVSMYNSKSFTNYNILNGLLNNYIWAIFEDSKGNIWFGSDGAGTAKYDGTSFTVYTKSDGLAGEVVREIVEDERNNIWFATNNGLSKFDGESFYTYREENGLGGNNVSDICLGANNRLFITTENGYSVFDGVVFTLFSERDGLSSNLTTKIYEDSESNVWIGTADSGVCMFDGYTFFSFNERHGLAGNTVTTLLEDKDKQIWIGTANEGISLYNRSTFTSISREQGLSNNTIQALFQDANLNVWIGTQGGLNKYNEHSFKNYTEDQGLGGPIIKSICEDQFGNMWFGHLNGVSKYDGHKYENYGAQQGLGNNTVRAIIQDQNANMWFATEGSGAIFYDGEFFTHYNKESGLSSNTILSIYEDADGNVWFGTFGAGLTKFDGVNFSYLTTNEGLLSNTIRSITQDNEGNMWFGTNAGGLEKFDGEYITHYTTKEGLASNTILSLMTDASDNLWVGTESGGINILSKDKILTIGVAQGLSNGLVWSMIEDYENNVWVGTEKGLNYIETSVDQNFHITNFAKLDGLKGIDFYPNSACLDSDNKMWWGTGKALSMLDLNKYARINSPPKLSITDLLINEKAVDFRELQRYLTHKDSVFSEDYKPYEDIKLDSILKFTNYPSHIVIPYNLNHLTIQFSANDWTAPHKIKYMHKLEGVSNEWHTLTNDNKVVHSFLPEGDYTFYLKAIGEAEIWSKTIQLKITVSPPWWKSLLAYITYIVITVLVITIITTLRTKKLIQQRKLLEKLVSKRTEEVVKQKELVETQNKEIIDSINYAKRIQRAILPSSRTVKRKLANAFVLFMPKDIVAGDFYWLEEKNEKILLAAADCTGHGVPGAMVSLVCNNTLSRTVREFNLDDPALILNKVRDIVIESFTNSYEEVKDGMDIALISLDIKTNKLRFAGANNNLYVVSNGIVKIFKGDRQPIGKYIKSNDFNVQEIQLHPNDVFYLFTDGYTDQFGGERGKKFKTRQFLALLLDIHQLPMRQQQRKLENEFNSWKGPLEQVDDVCVIGVKV